MAKKEWKTPMNDEASGKSLDIEDVLKLPLMVGKSKTVVKPPLPILRPGIIPYRSE